MALKHSRTRAITSVCHPTDRPEDRYLVQVIQIDCEACEGTTQIQVIGHHIPAVLQALQKAQEQYPELCKAITTEIPQGITTVILPPPGGKAM